MRTAAGSEDERLLEVGVEGCWRAECGGGGGGDEGALARMQRSGAAAAPAAALSHFIVEVKRFH